MRRNPQAAGAALSRWWGCVLLLPLSSGAMAQVAVLDCGADGAKPMVVHYFDGDAPKGSRGQAVALKPLLRPRACAGSGPCEAVELTNELSCRKPQGVFVFRFKPVPINPTPQGMCAGNVTGELVVVHKGRQVLPPTMFEDVAACFDTRADAQRIRSVTVDPARGRPAIEYASARP